MEDLITRSYPHKRKTVKVDELVNWANHQLARKDDYALKDGFKSGICVTIETVLHYTNNYRGYTPLNPNATIGSVGYYERHYSLR